MRAGNFQEAVKHRDFPCLVWHFFEEIVKKPNKKRTFGPVVGILLKIHELSKKKNPSLIAHLSSKDPSDAFELFKNMNGIGDKISSLILRELHTRCGLWKGKLNSTTYYYLFPVDTWLRKLSELVGVHLPETSLAAMKRGADACNTNNVNPIEYNKGAWFLGSYFDEICIFHRIKTEDIKIENLPYLLPKFNPCQVANALTRYFNELRNHRAFPLTF